MLDHMSRAHPCDSDIESLRALSPCDYAAALPRKQFMDSGLRTLWPQPPRIAGPAFTVQLQHGDNLMLHAAIYEAPPGSVLVVNAPDCDFAVAGGNVCSVAQRRGIAGLVVDGAVRDLAEIRDNGFPVFARGVVPYPGAKRDVSPLNMPVICGGVTVNSGDIVIADEEGIVVVPQSEAETTLSTTQAHAEQEAKLSLDEWQAAHHAKIKRLLSAS